MDLRLKMSVVAIVCWYLTSICSFICQWLTCFLLTLDQCTSNTLIRRVSRRKWTSPLNRDRPMTELMSNSFIIRSRSPPTLPSNRILRRAWLLFRAGCFANQLRFRYHPSVSLERAGKQNPGKQAVASLASFRGTCIQTICCSYDPLCTIMLLCSKYDMHSLKQDLHI